MCMRSKWTSSCTTYDRKDPVNVHLPSQGRQHRRRRDLGHRPGDRRRNRCAGRRPASRTISIADAGRHADARRHAFCDSCHRPRPPRRPSRSPASSSSIPSMTTTPESPSTIRPAHSALSSRVTPVTACRHAGTRRSSSRSTRRLDPRHVGRLPRRGAARPHDHHRWRCPGPGVRPEGPIREHRRPRRRPSPCPDVRQCGQCRRRRGRVPVTGALLLTRVGVRARKTQPETGGSSLAWNPAPRRVVR